jgi:hypothetical protein
LPASWSVTFSAHVQADDDLVFPHPQTGNPYETSKLRKRFVTAVKKAGAETTFDSTISSTRWGQVGAAGVPLRTLQEWMGHRDYKTTWLYADYQPDERRDAGVTRWLRLAASARLRGIRPVAPRRVIERPENACSHGDKPELVIALFHWHARLVRRGHFLSPPLHS